MIEYIKYSSRIEIKVSKIINSKLLKEFALEAGRNYSFLKVKLTINNLIQYLLNDSNNNIYTNIFD
jgi:hypothetical protein